MSAIFQLQNQIIPTYLCDSDDRLHIWAVARLFQDVAEKHTNVTNIGFHHLMNQGKAWVVSRMYYQIHSLPAVGDNVMLNTWSKGVNGLYALREFQMIDEKDGAVLASASSYWVVIDFQRRKASRLDTLMDGYEHYQQEATDKPTLYKIPRNTIEEFSLVSTFAAHYSNLDHTQHVNNAEYLKWIFDFLPPEVTPAQVKSIDIDYILESRADETISLFRSPIYNDSELYFKILNPRGDSFIARLVIR